MEEIDTSSQIAIIGMAGRFPGANNINQLWQNLLDNIDSLELLKKDELLKLGIPENTIKGKDYVAAARVLADIEYFDYAFFGLSRREAELMDPQIRLLMQCAYNTFEDARIIPQQQDNVTGVYVGIGANKYLLDNILPNKEVLRSVGAQMVQLVNDRDFAATQLAYRLNLKGPAVNVSTACSTSLVAVHNAVQALLAYECDMALAGGASITPIQRVGYQYQQGSIASPDGRCRPFDKDAQGTCYGSGVATVLLKRFDEAKADGDKIYAVIRASAINNDGAEKIGFTAPSVKGQARVISDAIELAEIDATNISYIEAHGTATNLGDPIEFEALSQAFGGVKNHSCGIGSIKSNIGHLDTAAGITGLIKTSLSVYHGQIPASLHFKKPNPEIDLENSPFYVVDSLRNWPSPRIAGISSFGMGGTNAHVIVSEENTDPDVLDTAQKQSKKQTDWHLLPFSANDSEVLEQLQASYSHAFQDSSNSLEDISWSLFHTRKAMPVRNFIVTNSQSNTGDLLAQAAPSFKVIKEPKNIVFMFPGQGSQQLAMAAQLSKHYPAYKRALEQALMKFHEETRIRGYLFEENQQCETSLLQPALFCHEYALAKLWQALGVQPTHLIGHSLGEYVAACIAGVFSLSDAVKIVQIRANLMTKMLPGRMLAIRASQSELEHYIDSKIELAAINGPKSCVLAGPDKAITELQAKLEKEGLSFQLLQTSHAFHSAAVEPLLNSFQNEMAAFVLNPPKIPIVSNVTGTWLTPQQATDPKYWCQHIRKPVLFNKGIQTLINEKLDCFIEVGPGKALSHFTLAAGVASENVITGISGQHMASHNLLEAMGRFWKIGGNIDTDRLYTKPVKSIDLPLYPFKKDRVWLSRNKTKDKAVSNDIFELPKTYQTIWQNHRIIKKTLEKQDSCWLFLADDQSFAHSLAENLCPNAEHIVIIPFQKFTANSGQITAESVDAVWHKLIGPLFEQDKPCQIINCWPLDYSQYSDNRDSLFDVIGYIGKILSTKLYQVPITFTTLTDRSISTSDLGTQNPIQSLAHSMPIVMQQEINGLIGQVIDIDLTSDLTMSLQTLSSELTRKERIPIRAIRNHQCWQPRFVELLQNSHAENQNWIQANGHYLITGGLGQLGLTLSHWLANQSIAALTLVTRSPIPDQSQWQILVDQESTDKTLKAKLNKLLVIKTKVKLLTILDTAWHSEQIIRDSINKAETINGPITGIFHSAAHFDNQTIQPLKQFNADNADQQFQTKVESTHALHKIFEEKSLDFVVLMSSLSAILAGPGHGIYSAANKFLDAQAKQSTSNLTQWLSIAWDGWNVSAQSGKGSITEDDAPKLFDSLFRDHGHTNLAVACQALEPRFDNWVRQVQHQIQPPSDTKKPVFEKSDILHILEKCWQDIIGVEECTADANFFALGGDSLAAVRLSGLIQQRMNINITAAELFAHSNFQDMTKLLTTHKQKTSDSLLVPLRDGQGEPILLIHPGGGGIAIYQSLLELLDLNNPFYGIRARGVDAGSDPRLFDDMKHLANEYARELATKFKGSSIILVGYCFGGLIANELAQAFENNKVSVSKVILLDSKHPRLRSPIKNSFSTHLNELFGDIPDVNIDTLAPFDKAEMTNYIAQQAKKSGKFPAEVSHQQAENYIRLAENHLTLELTYKPKPADNVVVLRAKDEINNNDQTDTLGWSDVPIFNVPGDHKTMIRTPHVNSLAQQMTDLIRNIS
jgi:acyl transferase domain-containing protein/thioesterase domain-containing protein/acyl carrier protein